MSKFDFGSLKVISIPVVDPSGKNLILQEASGDTVKRFNDERTRCLKFQDGGVSSVVGQGNLEMFLVSLCLFETDEDGKLIPEKYIPISTLQKWPGRVVTALFNKAKEISEIDPSDLATLQKEYEALGKRIAKMQEDMAKNEPNNTEIGSN